MLIPIYMYMIQWGWITWNKQGRITMDLSIFNIRGLMLYVLECGLNTAKLARSINNAFVKDSMFEGTAQDWFARFRTGDLEVEDRPRSGRPSGLDDERLRQLGKEHLQQTVPQLAKDLGVSPSTAVQYKRALGFVSKGEVDPLELTKGQRQRHVEAAVLLLCFRRTKTWLDSIVTREEKWFVYTNIQCKLSWCRHCEHQKSTAKAGSVWKRSCSQSVGTARSCCFWNCCLPTTASVCSCTANNLIVWPVIFDPSTSISAPSASFTTRTDSTWQKHHQPERVWSGLGSAHSSTVQSRIDALLLSSVTVSKHQPVIQNFLQRRWPASVPERFFSARSKTICGDGIQICPKWQRMIGCANE